MVRCSECGKRFIRSKKKEFEIPADYIAKMKEKGIFDKISKSFLRNKFGSIDQYCYDCPRCGHHGEFTKIMVSLMGCEK